MNYLKLALHGKNGRFYLLDGGFETALVDCSMAIEGEELLQNLKSLLGGRELTYLLMTHSHYDHIGALPILKKAYPGLVVIGAAHAQNLLPKPGVRSTILEYSKDAARAFSVDESMFDRYDLSLFSVDRAVREGDLITVGDLSLFVVESPGHTKCSLSYYLKAEKLLFTVETAGIVIDERRTSPSFLTSYEQTIESIKKLHALGAEKIVCPHYGLIGGEWAKNYFQNALKAALEAKELLGDSLRRGEERETAVSAFMEKFRTPYAIPLELDFIFRLNSGISYDLIAREYFAPKE